MALAVASVAPSAGAEPPRHEGGAQVFLDYERAPGAASCIAPDELIEAVRARLGRPVFVPASQADLIAKVRARRHGRRFVVSVELSDARHERLGRRELSTAARHCSALDDSLALVLSLAADVPAPQAEGDAALTPASPEPPSTPIVVHAPPTLETPLSIPETTHAPRLGVRVEPSLGMVSLMGPMPRFALGLELGVTVLVGELWPVSLRASGFWPETQRRGAGQGARFTARALELGVCPWEERLGTLSLRACVQQWLARVRARGFGFDEDLPGGGWAVAFGGGAELRRWFGPLFASLGVELLVPPLRRRYFFTNVTESATLHDEPWVFGAAAVRLGTEF